MVTIFKKKKLCVLLTLAISSNVMAAEVKPNNGKYFRDGQTHSFTDEALVRSAEPHWGSALLVENAGTSVTVDNSSMEVMLPAKHSYAVYVRFGGSATIKNSTILAKGPTETNLNANTAIGLINATLTLENVTINSDQYAMQVTNGYGT